MSLIRLDVSVDREENQIQSVEANKLEACRVDQSIAFLATVAQFGQVMPRLEREAQKVSMMVVSSEKH